MNKKIAEQVKAKELRALGYSVKQIAKELNVAPASVSVWVRNVVISEDGKEKIVQRVLSARQKGLSSMKEKRGRELERIIHIAITDIQNLKFNKSIYRILAGFLYWGEGSKRGYSLSFINSDPQMIEAFLFLFRKGFDIDETKFRCLVHIHEYHNEQEVKEYWSKITGIPLSQFTKSYLKPNTGKVLREGYLGSLNIKYYDSSIYHQIKVSYQEFFNQVIRGVG